MAKKTTAVKKKAAPIKNETTKKPSAEVKKEEPKKLTVKKEPEKLTVKAEPKKVTTKSIKKIAAQPEPKKVAVKEVKQLEVKDAAESKKAAAVQPAAGKEKKPAVKKAVKKPSAADEKKAYYETMSLEDCIANMQKMNVQYHYEDYAQLLTDEGDLKQLIMNIHEGNHLGDLQLDYKRDGYDQDLVKITLEKVKGTMDLTPADFRNLKKEMDTSMKYRMSDDAEENAAEYLKEFHLCERIMMLAKRRHMVSIEEMDTLLKADVRSYTQHFMDIAYALLPTWQYNDVVFYEDFMYSYVSSFPELYLLYEQRIQLDCADLYIRHGDRGRGNAGYDYLLRENQIKDYIYYRFAHVYEDIDLEMAKSIAHSALQYVDDRFVYYTNIMEIINK